ncbi:unnamed protein product [Meloidogyne enterolobii]|uniref:Uncharacterized protein n=1 Tax=Meloidogyne enterolobii TaxID=390850 RepID=A0ACB0XYU9_MELEN
MCEIYVKNCEKSIAKRTNFVVEGLYLFGTLAHRLVARDERSCVCVFYFLHPCSLPY